MLDFLLEFTKTFNIFHCAEHIFFVKKVLPLSGSKDDIFSLKVHVFI